ncbi:MAG: VWA domain-containing protein [Rivularia sp. ALOHA_DT_140]|nr:VWA domain-containing protein [Rivularia sp. ALOHA_DT_140]
MNNQSILFNFINHLSLHNQPFELRHNGKPPEWDDEALHQEAYSYNPELYALFSTIEIVTPEQRLRILFQILKASRKGFSHNLRSTLESVTNFLLTILHPDKVLTVFLALKRVRANHKHTTRAILKYIFEHPQSLNMAVCRRPAVVDCLEHAIGKNVARACAKFVTSGADETYLNQNLLRFLNDREKVKTILKLLYRHEALQTPTGEYRELHQKYTQILESQQERPKTVTATNRGDIAATLVHLYRGGQSEQLMEAVENYVNQAAAKLPRFNKTLALVFDASASTQSYGDRQYCCLAQSVALKLVLEKCCTKVKVYQVGGTVDVLPTPQGYSDIATSVLDAVKGNPDLIVIVSDGYENLYPGDLSRVVASLPQIGIETPVVFCHSKFTSQDDLELRRPAKNLPQLEFWHQEDFGHLMLSMMSMVGEKTEADLREFLLARLNQLENEFTKIESCSDKSKLEESILFDSDKAIAK